MFPIPKQRLRFKAEDTLILLQEVVKENPYKDKEKWEEIRDRVAAATQKDFTIRGIRDHVEYTLKIWMEENRINLNNAEIKEVHTKRDRLLQEILDLRKGLNLKTRQSSLQKLAIKVTHIASENVNTHEINEIKSEAPILPGSLRVKDPQELYPISSPRPVLQNQDVPLTSSKPTSSTKAFSTVGSSLPEGSSEELPSTSTKGPIRHRKNRSILKNPTLRFFEERFRTETHFQKEILKFKQEKFQFEKDKFKLEEAKLKLEEQKFNLEKEERLVRLQLETKERQNSIDAVNQQRQLIRMLLHLVNKSNIST